jgi:hypothetical protein
MNATSDYFSEYLKQKIYERLKLNANSSLFFQNCVYANSNLMQIIFDHISLINFSKEEHENKFPIRLKISHKIKSNDKLYQNTKFGQANFNLIINDMQDLIYAHNLLDIHNNLVKPFLSENKDKLEIVPDEYKRFYFFRNPLVLPQYGKSLTNLDSASSSDPHGPLNDLIQLDDYYMSHFRSTALYERIDVSIDTVIFDFNYFFCYFQPILERYRLF